MHTLTFEEPTHVYHLDGVRVPSVTGILRQSGVVDFSKVPAYILAAAQARGTRVHAAVHYWNENDLDVGQFVAEFPDDAGYLLSWMRLVESGRLQPVLCEHRVAAPTYGYAGTIDWLGLFDGHAAILDFATGDPVDCAKDLQTAGYVIAAKEWAAQPDQAVLRDFLAKHTFIARYSVRLWRDGRLPGLQRYTDPRHLTEFLTLMSAYRIVEARKPQSIRLEEYAA